MFEFSLTSDYRFVLSSLIAGLRMINFDVRNDLRKTQTSLTLSCYTFERSLIKILVSLLDGKKSFLIETHLMIINKQEKQIMQSSNFKILMNVSKCANL